MLGLRAMHDWMRGEWKWYYHHRLNGYGREWEGYIIPALDDDELQRAGVLFDEAE